MKSLLTRSDAAPLTTGRRLAEPLTAPPVATPLAAERPKLFVVRGDDRATAVVRELDQRLSPRGEMQEYKDATGRGPTLFRYTGFDGEQSAFSVPPGRLTPHIRALMWELAEAIDDAGRN